MEIQLLKFEAVFCFDKSKSQVKIIKQIFLLDFIVHNCNVSKESKRKIFSLQKQDVKGDINKKPELKIKCLL